MVDNTTKTISFPRETSDTDKTRTISSNNRDVILNYRHNIFNNLKIYNKCPNIIQILCNFFEHYTRMKYVKKRRYKLSSMTT